MKSIATTRMSSKGQVVIPEQIREALKLSTGEQFVVLGERDVIILKMITPPSLNELDQLIHIARKQAKEAGIKKSDLSKIIKKIRVNA